MAVAESGTGTRGRVFGDRKADFFQQNSTNIGYFPINPDRPANHKYLSGLL